MASGSGKNDTPTCLALIPARSGSKRVAGKNIRALGGHPLLAKGSIAGEQILPFITEGMEGFDINRPEDWIVAEHLLHTGAAKLPPVFVKTEALA